MSDVARMYSQCLWSAFDQGLKWGEVGACKVALLDNTYNPNQDDDNFWSDISSYEIAAGDGYTAGGEALTWAVETLPFVYVPGSVPGGTLQLKADDVSWVNLTASFQYAVIYYDTGTPANNALIGYIQYNTGTSDPVEPVAQTFTIEWVNGVVGTVSLATT